MPRRPAEHLSQHALVLELRLAIDAARRGEKRGIARARQLVNENPVSSRATHVRYNIGKRRCAWLDNDARSRAWMPYRDDAPLVGEWPAKRKDQ